MAVRDDMHERDGFFVELVAAGFDARQIEDLVDQIQQMHAGVMDVGGVVLVDRHGMATEDLALHHFGKAENGVQRRAQFMAHLREEARLGDIGGFGAVARFVGDGLGLFEFADQGVLLGAGFQRRERGRMQPLRQKREIAFGCDGQNGQHVVVEGAAQDEAQRHAEGHRRGGGKGGNRQARGEHAGDRDHQQHQEHHQRLETTSTPVGCTRITVHDRP